MGSLLLVRHGFAGAPDKNAYPNDGLRPLTDKGARKFGKAAEGLGELITPDAVLHSPLVRTASSAAILNYKAGWPISTATSSLDGDPKDVVDEVKKQTGWPGTIALVGHGPNLIQLISYLLTGDSGLIQMDFNKGGACLITIGTDLKSGTGQLSWFMTQRALKAQR